MRRSAKTLTKNSVAWAAALFVCAALPVWAQHRGPERSSSAPQRSAPPSFRGGGPSSYRGGAPSYERYGSQPSYRPTMPQQGGYPSQRSMPSYGPQGYPSSSPYGQQFQRSAPPSQPRSAYPGGYGGEHYGSPVQSRGYSGQQSPRTAPQPRSAYPGGYGGEHYGSSAQPSGYSGPQSPRTAPQPQPRSAYPGGYGGGHYGSPSQSRGYSGPQSPRTAPQPRTAYPGTYGSHPGTSSPQHLPSQGGVHAFPGQGGNPSSPASRPGSTTSRPAPSGHLGTWLDQHHNLAPQEQERVLRSDPSFSRLPSGEQQKLVQQLHHVDRLNDQQRQRRLARNEAIGRLSQQQRISLNRSNQAFSGLPAQRQNMVKRAFQDLRSVPVDQRQTVLNSARYQGAFSPEERGILSDFLRVEPYQPSH